MNFPKKCGLCSAECHICYSLLEDKSRMLESLTSIKIEENTSLSTEACVTCWLNLKYAYKIQQRFIKNCRPHNVSDYSGLDHIEIEEVHFCDGVIVKKELNFESINPLEILASGNDDTEKIVPKFQEDGKSVVNETNIKEIVKEISGNKITPCKICGDSIFENEMIEHTKSHLLSRLKCDQCNIYCSNIESYRNHVAQVHTDSSSSCIWTCKICKATFSYKPLYLIHQNKAHIKQGSFSLKLKKHGKQGSFSLKLKKLGDENKPYDCPYCKKRFSNEESSLKHIKGHNKKKCDICGALVTPSNFGAHMKTHKEKPVACHICGGFYKNSVCLRSHIHYTHSTTEYLCEFCHKMFKKSYALSLHIKKEHTGEKSHTCDICGKQFFTFFNLNTHKKMTHLKLRPHACQYCHKKFSSKFARVTHERQHTNVKPYKCEICGQGYRQNVSLKSHKKSAHNVVEELTCECEICGKRFGSNFAVISHMRLH